MTAPPEDGTRPPSGGDARRPSRVRAIDRDGAGRRRTEEALRTREELLLAFVEHTPAAVAMFDRGMRYLAWSRRWLSDYGLSEQHLFGRCHYDVFPEIPEHWKAVHRRCLAGAVERCERDPFPRRDGRLDWVRWEILPWHEPDGRQGGIVMFTEVVTEQVELEERMRQSQKLESLGVLAGGIAHDFNNLLVAISGNARLALDALPPDAPARTRIADVVRAGEQAADLTRQLLIYAGKDRSAPRALDLSALVDDMTSLLRTGIPGGVRLEGPLDPEPLWVHGDATQLRQVVLNLVTNAAEAVSEGGRVRVRTGRLHAAPALLARCRVRAEGASAGDYALLEVEDTGSGMEPGVLARIFDPFYSTKTRGRGLGLAAVLGIVRGHGGALDVCSRPGEGTRFRLLLPGTEAPPEPTAEPPPPGPSARERGTVLVVDDDAGVREVTAALLGRLGFAVRSAPGGREALAALREGRDAVTVVLLDLSLEDAGGEEVFHALRREAPELPVLFFTGHSPRETGPLLAGKRRVGLLGKPFDMETLAAALGELLERPVESSAPEARGPDAGS